MNALTLWRELDGLDGLWNVRSSTTIAPRVDVRERKENYELVAELPGFALTDVQVQVKDGVLELSAQKPDQPLAEEERWLIRERRDASFTRSFRLPKDVEGEAIAAEFRDGLLFLTLPKKEEAKPRQIPIKAA